MPFDDPRERFAFFSDEYAQALQAIQAIESQASTLMVMGSSDELRGFIAQFLEMAERTKQMAEEEGEPNFAEWFGELVERAEALRNATMPHR